MHTINNPASIVATEKQYNILRNVPLGSSAFDCHRNLCPKLYQPNESLEATVVGILQQIRTYADASKPALDIHCPTPEILEEVSRRLQPHEHHLVKLQLGY